MGFRRGLIVTIALVGLAGCDRVLEVGRARPDAAVDALTPDDGASTPDAVAPDAAPLDAPATDAAIVDAG